MSGLRTRLGLHAHGETNWHRLLDMATHSVSCSPSAALQHVRAAAGTRRDDKRSLWEVLLALGFLVLAALGGMFVILEMDLATGVV